uniref:Putative Superfamily II DNA/RNA helicase, SNF2 family n=1 Tax=mine drainage metagenome TaxID=410659 RepID=E6Q6S3_9ZZZZ
MELDFKEIADAFDDLTYERGARYFQTGRVLRLTIEGESHATGLVEGSRGKAYTVHIELGAVGGRSNLTGTCSCPVGWNCKHVVALALAIRRSASAGRNRVHSTGAPSEDGDGAVDVWMKELAERHERVRHHGEIESREHLRYTIDLRFAPWAPKFVLQAWVVPILKSGAFGSGRDYGLHNLSLGNHKAVVPIDRTIGRLAQAAGVMEHTGYGLSETLLGALLDLLVQTRRTHWQSLKNSALRYQPIERGSIAWILGDDARQHPRLKEQPTSVLLPSVPLWYVDPERGVAGPAHVDAMPEVAALVAASPALSTSQAERANVSLRHVFSGAGIEPPIASVEIQTIDADPVPALRLLLLPATRMGGYPAPARPAAELRFQYGEQFVCPGDAQREIRMVLGESVTLWPRRIAFEKWSVKSFAPLGLSPVVWPYNIERERSLHYFLYDEEKHWIRFLGTHVPELVRAGWSVEIDPKFPYAIFQPGDEWAVDVIEDVRPQWFELELGIEVEGERIPLLPVLVNALERAGHSLATNPKTIEQRSEPFLGKLPDGKYVSLAPERVARILATIGALVAESNEPSRNGRINVPAVRAAALADADGMALRWTHARSLRATIDALVGYAERSVKLPKSFKAELRPYQREGVAWLQTLREQSFGGVLADDMGLGKTIQVLAHIAIERASKRLASPVLVVAPTSVVPNWRAEIARFLPAARVLSLTGLDRSDRFAEIDDAEIVLSTYALLPRDIEAFAERDWSLVVLDEAQAIKNPKAKAGIAAARLRANQRIALTGTPIENHLEELWSIYEFAVPGLLPDRTRFSRIFRTPIEKHGDALRRRALAARIKPFFMRRTKEQVAPELPEKTEIVQHIELRGAQRDLYETIRIAMHKRVSEEVARRGLARSRIVLLDALLKMRQVCCDPRLLKVAAAQTVRESHKLDALMEMLESLIEDGRRILLFSQFTSMLDLIKPELAKREIAFVELRGETRDRETPVARFQAGEVPLFLISLKAGGTGLNLTAADTVIHYDPWWNPAVERQATDRAHRIGQSRHVFVYKLIAEGTVEERILELQQRKGDLAAGLLDDTAAKLDLSIDDIERLFS